MGLFSRTSRDLEPIKDQLENQQKRVREILEELRDLERSMDTGFRDQGERLDFQAKAVRLMAEEMDERIDRGNKIWRKIRASEYYEKEREEREEHEPTGSELRLFDGNGSAEEAVPAMHPGMAHRGDAVSKARQMGRALARRKAGME